MNFKLSILRHIMSYQVAMANNNKNTILSILVFIMPLCGFSIDLYTPFLPNITQLFHSTDLLGKLSVSIYIFGFGFGQLFFGYRSDQQGGCLENTNGITFFIQPDQRSHYTGDVYPLFFNFTIDPRNCCCWVGH